MSTIDERMADVLSARAAHIAACQRYSDLTRAVAEAQRQLSAATNDLHTAESALQREMIAVLGAPIHKPVRRITLDNARYNKLDITIR